MQQRSKIYLEIFPDELMLKAFGTTMPSQAAKNEYFFNCWMSWKENELRTFTTIPPSMFKTSIKEKCNQLGLREFWDYQTRGFAIRFKDAELLAFFRISVGDGWTI
jgi:hypothetical protein